MATALTRPHQALLREVQSLPSLARFQALRESSPRLAKFDSPHHLLCFLRHRSDDLDIKQQKSLLTADLIAEVQKNGCQFSQALLLCSYFFFLARIAGSVLGHEASDFESTLALAIECFLERVARFSLQTQSTFASLNLTRSTRRRFYRTIRRDLRRRRRERLSSSLATDGRLIDPMSPEQVLLQRERISEGTDPRIIRVVSDLTRRFGPDSVSLLLETYGEGVPLIEWVHDRYGDLPPRVLRNKYEACRKRRSRLVEQILARSHRNSLSHFGVCLALFQTGACDSPEDSSHPFTPHIESSP